jgi:Zn-dependent protease with chaperone function
MKYHARLPEQNHNVSHQKPMREFVTLLAAVVAFILLVYWILGFFIDVAVNTISPEMEMAICESVMSEEKPMSAPIAADTTQLAIQALLSDLSQCMNVGFPITLSYAESETPNAFAAPGGKMVVLSGLLKHIKSENGLAFVLAHELGHFKNRDHLRGMGRGVVLMALSFLATGNAYLSKLLTPVNVFQNAQFSQRRERDADATALEIIQCHYGHVAGATEFFETMVQPDEALPLTHYFQSHPEARARIESIEQLSKEMGYSKGKVNPAFWLGS